MVDLSHKDLWSIDLRTGREEQLTSLEAGPVMEDFDTSRDGRTIVFDRTREESDIVLSICSGDEQKLERK